MTAPTFALKAQVSISFSLSLGKRKNEENLRDCKNWARTYWLIPAKRSGVRNEKPQEFPQQGFGTKPATRDLRETDPKCLRQTLASHEGLVKNPLAKLLEWT